MIAVVEIPRDRSGTDGARRVNVDRRCWYESRRRRRDSAASKMTSQMAATLDPSGVVVASLMVSGGFGVTQACTSATRSRLHPEIVDHCSLVGRMVSRRDRAIIREMNESIFALNFLETGGM